MVYSEHDANFYALDKQVCAYMLECLAVDPLLCSHLLPYDNLVCSSAVKSRSI